MRLLAFAFWLLAPIVTSLLSFCPSAASECLSKHPTVALDIGHSPAAPGAVSASGVDEYQFNRRLVEEIAAEARNEKRSRFLILNEQGDNISLSERTRLATARGADIFLSIHHDSVNDRYLLSRRDGRKTLYYTNAFRGFSLFVSSANPKFRESLAIAVAIGRNLKDEGLEQSLHHAEPIPGEGRKLLNWELGIYDAPFAVLKTARVPAVLLEAGVISNPDEESLLDTPAYRRKLSRAVIDALDRTCF